LAKQQRSKKQMGDSQTANRDATKVVFKGRTRYGTGPFVAKVVGRPGDSGYDPNGPKKMRLVMLVSKTETATLAALQEVTNVAIVEKWGSRRPPKLRLPWQDGDERKEDGTYEHPGDEFRGVMLVTITAKEERMPLVAKGPKGALVQAQKGDFEMGYWVTATCRAAAYSNSKNNGVSLWCNGIHITAEDAVFRSDDPIADLDAALAGPDDSPPLSSSGGAAAPLPAGGKNPADQFK
jgi:hypothetical protein